MTAIHENAPARSGNSGEGFDNPTHQIKTEGAVPMSVPDTSTPRPARVKPKKKIACPDWCADKSRTACYGEHFSESTLIPATAGTGLQYAIQKEWNAASVPFTSILTRFSQNPTDRDDAPYISLFAFDGTHDVEICLRAHEARKVIAALKANLRTIDTIEEATK